MQSAKEEKSQEKSKDSFHIEKEQLDMRVMD